MATASIGGRAVPRRPADGDLDRRLGEQLENRHMTTSIGGRAEQPSSTERKEVGTNDKAIILEGEDSVARRAGGGTQRLYHLLGTGSCGGKWRAGIVVGARWSVACLRVSARNG